MVCLAEHNLGATLGWDALSDDPDGNSGGLGNRKGYAGYEHDPALAAAWTIYHVRHRGYNADLGRWTQRDPLGYVDGLSLYEYVSSNPARFTDSSGLQISDEPPKWNDETLPPWINCDEPDQWGSWPDNCKLAGESWCEAASRLNKLVGECERLKDEHWVDCNIECTMAWQREDCGRLPHRPNPAKEAIEMEILRYCRNCSAEIVPSCYCYTVVKTSCEGVFRCATRANVECGNWLTRMFRRLRRFIEFSFDPSPVSHCFDTVGSLQQTRIQE